MDHPYDILCLFQNKELEVQKTEKYSFYQNLAQHIRFMSKIVFFF